MAKYDPLRDYLRKQSLQQIILTFREIEEIIGASLPVSAKLPQWWENVAAMETTHVQCKAWRAAGCHAFLVKGSKKVRFERSEPASKELEW
jgi:hypothetical protein